MEAIQMGLEHGMQTGFLAAIAMTVLRVMIVRCGLALSDLILKIQLWQHVLTEGFATTIRVNASASEVGVAAMAVGAWAQIMIAVID
mmetsp:Transcript_23094/g.37478  ORF Transcript_23094/g.37478 Transcript_23094/m.37478 type:complete len:87 (+) Transcript_23094:395-655(+)